MIPRGFISVAEFAKEVGTSDVTVYNMIKEGIIRSTEFGSKLCINIATERKRYYYYGMIFKGNQRNCKVDDAVLAEIDRMEEENASYAKRVAQVNHSLVPSSGQALGTAPAVASQRTLKTVNSSEHLDDFAIMENPEGSLKTLAANKLRREQALTKKAEIECAEKEGKLVNKEEMIFLWKEMGLKLRKSILSIPDRLAPVLAGQTDHHAIHRTMTEELKYALRNLSNELQAIGHEGAEEDVR